MTIFKQPVDRLYLTGLGLIVVSLLWFCLPFMVNIPNDNHFGLFVGNFVMAVIYFFILWGSGRLRRGREGLYPLLLFLVLFLISAYSLNREMTVFESSVGWFTTLQVLLCLNFAAFIFFERLPARLQHLMCFLLGISMVAFAYLSFYLVPLYAMSAAAFFILGISLHTFVPVLFCIYTIVLIRKKTSENKTRWYSFGAGIAFVLIVAVVYTIQWGSLVNTMNTTYRKAELEQKNNLPGWIAVAQKMPQGWMSRIALKSDLVYTMPMDQEDQLDGFFWRMPSRNFDEQRKHDPLVMVAALFAGRPNVPAEYRIKVLESIYDSRHQAQERLWSGENLFTENVKTAVKIWPQFCLSYTEKLITVTNSAIRRRWRGQEEAIYTFHFSEGTVVTSLSLWIEGHESKGLLTTKEKAANAYNTIVGREMRDPSVVHWQEGNTVSVRVFPVIAGESRLFKIGFTSPLGHKNDKLVYQNVYFDGPSVADTKEEVSLEFEKSPKDFIVPASFSTHNNTSFKTAGKYRADWNIELTREPLSTDAFSFNGKSFRIRPYQKQRAAASFNTVYLDVNESWSTEECKQVYDMFKDKAVYVYDEGITQLSNEAFAVQCRRLQKNKFSLFPIHEIADPANAIIISKSTANSPNLNDIKDTRFMQNMKTYLQQGARLKLFNLGDRLSPYLKSLKECRVFDYEQGNVADLQKLVASGMFATDIESDQRIVVDNAGIAITQEEGNVTTGNAPDHLMRLFAYNHIMKKSGSRLVTGEALNDDLVEEAKEAYIVTPVSSLVVLETQRDYDRFDITESENSLKNAAMGSKGAVPEPHEWALLVLAVVTLFYIRFRPTVRMR